ncbi:dual OB domain-containing protein [Actinokineospora sp. NPDC004072]
MRMLCLANSRKHSHRCVAGVGEPPSWIRPIGDREGHGVTEEEITTQDGTQPRPLDVVEFGVIRYAPSGPHRENWLLDSSTPWRRVGRCTWQQAAGLITRQPLWVNGHQSRGGINDYVPNSHVGHLTDSLRLILARPTIHVQPAYDTSKAADVRATFHHAGQTYRLKVTDPAAEDRFRTKGIGDYQLGDSLLTISLAEEMWNAYSQQWQHYKLVAAVLEEAAV